MTPSLRWLVGRHRAIRNVIQLFPGSLKRGLDGLQRQEQS
jgi:hypothetical protein